MVIGIEDNDKKYLCGYYVSNVDIPTRELKRYLSTTLPEYMVPSFLVRMDALPLSVNGKTDRKYLPLPLISSSEVQAEYAPPRNILEEELVEIIQEVLEIEKIGIDDSLFDLGGDSLTVMMVFSRI